MLKKRESILFVVLAIGIVILTLIQLDQTFFLFGIGQVLLYFIYGLSFLYGIVRVVMDKRKIPPFEKAKPLLLGSTLICFFFLLSYLVQTDGGKKRLISCGFNHDLNFVNVQLFSENRFRFLNSGPFGGSIDRGKYTLQNDTLRFYNDSLKYLYPSLTLVLKNNAQKVKSFESIDSSGALYTLQIYEDLREVK